MYYFVHFLRGLVFPPSPSPPPSFSLTTSLSLSHTQSFLFKSHNLPHLFTLSPSLSLSFSSTFLQDIEKFSRAYVLRCGVTASEAEIAKSDVGFVKDTILAGTLSSLFHAILFMENIDALMYLTTRIYFNENAHSAFRNTVYKFIFCIVA